MRISQQEYNKLPEKYKAYFVQLRNTHPTIKNIQLMRYLVKLVTPKNGIVLDPFLGSGTTCIAAIKENFNYIGIEREEEYYNIAKARVEHAEWKKQEQPTLFDGLEDD